MIAQDSKDRRIAARAPAFGEARVTDRSEQLYGELRNVSAGGAFVYIPLGALPQVGAGVRARFRVAVGVEIDCCAKVLWARERADATGPRGCGIEFQHMGHAEKRALAGMVSEAGSEQAGVVAQLESKYTVDARGGQVRITVGGVLNGTEAHDLLCSLSRALNRAVGLGHLAVYCDARALMPCPDESLVGLRACFSCLAEQKELIGLLHVEHSVTMLQMRRLAREAGLGETLVCFNNAQEAAYFWAQITSPRSGEYVRPVNPLRSPEAPPKSSR